MSSPHAQPRVVPAVIGLVAAVLAMGLTLAIADHKGLTAVVVAGEGGRVVIVVALIGLVAFASAYKAAVSWLARKA